MRRRKIEFWNITFSKCHFYSHICVLVFRQGQSLPSSDRVWDHTLPNYQHLPLHLQARLLLPSFSAFYLHPHQKIQFQFHQDCQHLLLGLHHLLFQFLFSYQLKIKLSSEDYPVDFDN